MDPSPQAPLLPKESPHPTAPPAAAGVPDIRAAVRDPHRYNDRWERKLPDDNWINPRGSIDQSMANEPEKPRPPAAAPEERRIELRDRNGQQMMRRGSQPRETLVYHTCPLE